MKAFYYYYYDALSLFYPAISLPPSVFRSGSGSTACRHLRSALAVDAAVDAVNVILLHCADAIRFSPFYSHFIT